MSRIYLDHAATSPMPAQVLDSYVRALTEVGNPASTHGHGQSASDRLEAARQRIADHLGCDPALVTLTGGGTEAVNLAIKGLYWARQQAAPQRTVLLIAEGEHHATLEAAEWLRDNQGAQVRWLPIDAQGVLRPDTLRQAIAEVGHEHIALVSFLWANNEVGTVQPIGELATVANEAGVPVHVDAIAALGQIPIDFANLGIAALSVSAHKIGGPVSVGALLMSRTAQLEPLFHGGSQQRARSGTQDVAGAVAFAAALDLVYGEQFEQHIRHLRTLRDKLVAGVFEAVPGARLRGPHVRLNDDPLTDGTDAADQVERLPGNAHFTFEGCQGDSLVFLLDTEGISASVGSACTAGVAEVSHVLLAMGIPEDVARGSLRFTLSSDTTEADIDALLAVLPAAVTRARAAGLS
ncbi:MAG: cysteine desulfurase [Leucobacter sp.]|nr:cysteine desulfurase [Leucobacter sp.]